jgi:hypothetical protein
VRVPTIVPAGKDMQDRLCSAGIKLENHPLEKGGVRGWKVISADRAIEIAGSVANQGRRWILSTPSSRKAEQDLGLMLRVQLECRSEIRGPTSNGRSVQVASGTRSASEVAYSATR